MFDEEKKSTMKRLRMLAAQVQTCFGFLVVK